MRPPRIVNRGRIAPSSPKPMIDSGRTSWSSASIVSSIDTRSPEPRITEEQVNQKLQLISSSTLKKKLIIGASVATALLIIVGVCLGVVLTSVVNKTSSETTATTITSQTTVSTRLPTTSPTTTATFVSPMTTAPSTIQTVTFTITTSTTTTVK